MARTIYERTNFGYVCNNFETKSQPNKCIIILNGLICMLFKVISSISLADRARTVMFMFIPSYVMWLRDVSSMRSAVLTPRSGYKVKHMQCLRFLKNTKFTK